MTEPVMADCSAEAVIEAPADAIDLTEWVFSLTDAEYCACSKDHVAAATTRAPDGRRMSINVERIGRLLVQHYVEEIGERSHCRLVSLSDTFGPGVFDQGRSEVLWEFSVEAIDGRSCRFVNHVRTSAVAGWREALDRQGLTLEQAQQRTHGFLEAHNAEETPLFAKDIERKAREGIWKS